MGRRAKHWLQILIDSGLPGLCIVIGSCVYVTLAMAQRIDNDEFEKLIVIGTVGSIVGAYRVWSTNRKHGNGNG